MNSKVAYMQPSCTRLKYYYYFLKPMNNKVAYMQP